MQSITELTDRSEGHVVGNWGKGDPRHKVAEDLDGLCSIEWKVELVSNDLGHLMEEISKQSAESVAWFGGTWVAQWAKGLSLNFGSGIISVS